MKQGFDEGFVFDENSKELLGVCLGADYAAEHEWGIEKILLKFDCDKKKLGLHSKKIKSSKNLIHGSFKVKNDEWFYFTSNKYLDAEKYFDGRITHDDKASNTKILTLWDTQDFIVYSTNKDAMEKIVSWFDSSPEAFVLERYKGLLLRKEIAFLVL